MSHRILSRTLASCLVLSSALAVSACATDGDDAGEFSAIENTTAVHLLPMRGADKVSDTAPPGAHLMNFGGPILPNVHVTPIFWNSGVQFQANLTPFYNDVPGSPLYSMLSQYGVGHGDGQAGVVDSRAAANVSDLQVQFEVLHLINSHAVPQPTNNTYYPMHFPPGMQITAPDGSQSCVVFCAYHGTFQVQNSGGTIFNVNYGVVPDQGGGCAGGCGGNAQRVNNLTSVSSHELIEATTDPAVGLATSIGFPLAWYDPNFGEIGDICNAQQGTTTGNGHSYTIQLEFSNAANDCVQN